MTALPSELHWLIVPNITAHVTAHWSGYVLLVLYVGSQVGYALLRYASERCRGASGSCSWSLPVFFVPFVIRFPVGLLMYWMTTNLWTVGQGIITRRMVPKPAPPPKRSSRTPPKETGFGDHGRCCGDADSRPGRRSPVERADRPASGQAQEEEGRAMSEGRLQVEATGETVGEAKWQALRELERLAPGLDKVGGSVRGRLRGRARPARGRLCAGAGDRERRRRRCVGSRRRLPTATSRRSRPIFASCSTRIARALRVDCQVDVGEDDETVTGIAESAATSGS